MPTSRQTDKQNVMEYYTVDYLIIKRNEILINSTTWMDPENMLCGRS